MTNTLYYGDNLDWLRKMPAEAVDLIYLDPPFNSNASYNVCFRTPHGERATAQIRAFEDTWSWGEEAECALSEVAHLSVETFKLLQALKSFLGPSDVMAYLVMMAVRLIELRRVLKETGSIYLHCDPTASHYLKILMDGIFGTSNYRNEIVWLRSKNPKGSQYASVRFGPSTDTILYYVKSDKATLDVDNVRVSLSSEELIEKYDREDERGHWLDGPVVRSSSMGVRPNLVYEYNGYTPGSSGWRMTRDKLQELDCAGNLYWTAAGRPRRKFRPEEDRGNPAGNFWGDIAPVNSQAKERIGYPTQKPLTLLERIIRASSKPGDVVLDPFCGCGTAIHAAERLDRRWIGIDITYVAIQVIEDRLKTWLPNARYQVHGIPSDGHSARALAERDPYQFQLWAVGRVGGQPRGKGADRGIDGEVIFMRGQKDYGHAIVSVKAGRTVNPDMIRALKGTVQREGADMGIFICVNPPTKEMKIEAASGGRIDLPGGSRSKIQIVTAEDLVAGPNLGIVTTLNIIRAAEAGRNVQKQKARRPARRDPKQRHFMLPLDGGQSENPPARPLETSSLLPDCEPGSVADAAILPAPLPKRRRKAG